MVCVCGALGGGGVVGCLRIPREKITILTLLVVL